MRVAKWGNSLGIRIPASVVQALELSEGDEVELRVEHDRSLVVSRRPDADALFERLRAMRDSLPEDFVFDREEAGGR